MNGFEPDRSRHGWRIGIISQLSASSRAEDFYNALLKKTSDKIYFALEGKDEDWHF